MSHLPRRQTPAVTTALIVADVPVRVIIKHGMEVLEDYDEVIPIEIGPGTREGQMYAYRLQSFQKSGFTTEEGLFLIARGIVENDVLSINPFIKGHNLGADVKPNGKITYRARQKIQN